MKPSLPSYKARLLLGLILGGALVPLVSFCHDWPIHQEITASAYLSSQGLQVFLSGNLVSNILTASQPQCPASLSASNWLTLGSKMEDEQKYRYEEERTMDHFYAVTSNRTAGLASALTDGTEHPWWDFWNGLPGGLVNSYVWATQYPTVGPLDVDTNFFQWANARQCQIASLTNSNPASRGTNMAVMFYTLGHILHLLQDLSSPDHTRNDNHYSKAWIEDYGLANYTNNPQWFVLQAHGWPYWQSEGFQKLLDFWDRGTYLGNASALNDDAAQTSGKKLGLAEFSNGNFLGEDALYKEFFATNDFHYFPFPSLFTSTTFPAVKLKLSTAAMTTALKNGSQIVRIRIGKTNDGIIVTNHSVLKYLASKIPSKLSSTSGIASMTTINDPQVIQEYLSILIPKATEYSAGLLDYFFRGTMYVQTIGTNSDSPPLITNSVCNTSGQSFTNGTFHIFYDDTNNWRTEIASFSSTYSGSLAPGESFTNVFTTVSNAARYILLYQGSVGATDPVDTNIAIAVAAIHPTAVTITNEYDYFVGDDFLPSLPATISTNLASDDFPFTPTVGNFEAFVNGGTFDDEGTIGGLSTFSGSDCGYPATFANTPLAIPPNQINVVGSHLEVTLTCTDNCPVNVGWEGVSITWRAWPAP